MFEKTGAKRGHDEVPEFWRYNSQMKDTLREDFPARIAIVRSICEREGISLTNGNSVARRVIAAEKFCVTEDKFTSDDIPFFRLVGEALLLADLVGELEGKIAFRRHLKKLVSESDFYDKLIELSIGMHFIQAGYGLEDVEPDWIVTLGGTRIAIACKRVSSENALLQALRKARDQVRATRLPGIIVMDISWFETAEPATIAASARVAMDGLIASSRTIVGPLRPHIKALLRDEPDLYGVMIHQGQSAFLPVESDAAGTYFPTALNHYGCLWSRRPAEVEDLLGRFAAHVEM